MKNFFLSFLVLLSFTLLNAQTFNPENLKAPDAPGFQILDVSPTSIEKPLNPKALGATLLNLSNNGNSIPKNFALEVSPYWYFKDHKASIHRYLNIEDDENHKNNFSGILNKLSVSMASVYNDTTSGSLLKKTNYLSFGIRTNLYTYRKREQNERFKKALKDYSDRFVLLKAKQISTDSIDSVERIKKTEIRKFKKLISEESDVNKRERYIDSIIDNTIVIKEINNLRITIQKQTNNAILKTIKADEEINNYLKQLDELPAIQIDGAFAYSEAFPDNETASRRFNRSGVWVNASLKLINLDKEKLNHNISAIFLGKYISDNILMDSTNNIFERQKAYDVGIKIDYTVKDFSLAFEYIERNYSDDAFNDSHRNVFVMQYKISDGVYFTGSYGKNFGYVNNLFSLFGINYGFGKTELNPLSK